MERNAHTGIVLIFFLLQLNGEFPCVHLYTMARIVVKFDQLVIGKFLVLNALKGDRPRFCLSIAGIGREPASYIETDYCKLKNYWIIVINKFVYIHILCTHLIMRNCWHTSVVHADDAHTWGHVQAKEIILARRPRGAALITPELGPGHSHNNPTPPAHTHTHT